MALKNQRLLLVAALLLWCVVLVFFRVERLRVGGFGLLWNLFLAVIPLLASSAFDVLDARRNLIVPAMWFGLWLLFFPNAPYICTDLIHLRPNSGAPEWYDLAMFMSFAGAGLFFGYASLLEIHQKIEARWGKRIGWSVALASLVLCAFGIYIGRFLRWNSWDAFTRPRALMHHLWQIATQPSEFPHPFSVTLVFGIALILGYAALRLAVATACYEKSTPE